MNGRAAAWAAILLGAVAAAGCHSPNYTTLERYDRGLVVVLDGAGGITTAPQQICRGLDRGGVDHALEVFQWSEHDLLGDQTNIERNREVAGRLASRVAGYAREYPRRPIHLIGLSAGTGIVIFAAERLPADYRLDGICLLASSLNSGYDLTEAMERVRNEITNFSSVLDVGILGVGVAVAGTVDRGQDVSAGLYGFHLPKGASERTRQLYKEKLIEVPWNPTFVVYGHLGDHLGAASVEFVRHKMAPIVLDAARRRGGGRTGDAWGSARSQGGP